MEYTEIDLMEFIFLFEETIGEGGTVYFSDTGEEYLIVDLDAYSEEHGTYLLVSWDNPILKTKKKPYTGIEYNLEDIYFLSTTESKIFFNNGNYIQFKEQAAE